MIVATKWAKERYGSSQRAYRVVIALYPSCGARYREFASLVTPLRLHLAGKDELTPSRYCESLVANLRTHGADVAATVYADAHHAFDLPTPVQYLPDWNNFADCSFDLPSVDSVLSQQDLQRCAKKGTRLGGHHGERARFQENMLAELQTML